MRRVGGALHTFGALFEPGWAHESRTELRWLLGLLAQEPAFLRRSTRLLSALDTLSATGQGGEPRGPGMLAGHPGAPKARALLDRQLTLARTRAHSSVLQELRSSRLHALADRMTLLVGEAPLQASAGGRAGELLPVQAAVAFGALGQLVQGLPLHRAATAYQGMRCTGSGRRSARRRCPPRGGRRGTRTGRWRRMTRRGTGCGCW